LGKEFSDDLLSLIPIFSIAANFRKELLDFIVITIMEGIDTDLDNASVIDRLSIIVTVIDNLWYIGHDEELFRLFSLIYCMVKN
jgi:hypothetical protein